MRGWELDAPVVRDLAWLGDAQLAKNFECSPLSRRKQWVDDRRGLSGLIFLIKSGLRWRDAPADYGPPKTPHDQFIRWSWMGVLDRVLQGLAARAREPDGVMIDATHLKAHRTTSALLE